MPRCRCDKCSVLYLEIPYGLIADEEMCQGCGVMYDDDDEAEQAGWIGCDNECGRWYHYWCAGFTRKPRHTTKFLCELCND